MTWRFAFVALVAVFLCGCSPPSSATAPSAGSSHQGKTSVPQAVLLEAIARLAEDGEFETNNEFFKVTVRAMKANDIDPDQYADALKPYAASNDKLDGAKAAAVLRSLK